MWMKIHKLWLQCRRKKIRMLGLSRELLNRQLLPLQPLLQPQPLHLILQLRPR